VIATEDYYRRYNGQTMYVSQWEGHPNEIAHFIWAKMIEQRLRAKDVRESAPLAKIPARD
jgi:hypothetical protein